MLKFIRICSSKADLITKNQCKNRICTYHNANSRVLSSYSTQTQSSASSDALYKRLLPARDARVSIVPILDQWVREEAHPVEASDLRIVLKRLRNSKRVSHALQLADWMTEKNYMNLTPGEAAIKLDLIAKVHGVGDAENYFTSIPDKLKTYKVYGSLLNCYAEKGLLDKAETVLQHMRDSGYNLTLSYNVMLNLYAKLQKLEKLHNLFQEMEETGITYGKTTFCIMLNAYVDSSNIESMEKLLSRMENDRSVTMTWNAFVVAAKGYTKAGLAEKASEMLKKAEKHISSRERKFGYLLLLSMYASLGNKYEVNRMWNLYKVIGNNINNVAYVYMISSLVKLDDLDEAEKILEEWESVNVFYDFRVPNVLINVYTKKGLMEKAEALVNRASGSGKEPPASTWDFLTIGYYKHNQMDKAVETMKKAISANQYSWKLNHHAMAACIEYLKEKGDIEKAEELTTLLKQRGIILRDRPVSKT